MQDEHTQPESGYDIDEQTEAAGEPNSSEPATLPIISDTEDGDEQEIPSLAFPVVGIGASAGGLEAYIELFQHLPFNTGMAFVVVSHLPPDQRSHLPEIVARHTKMQTVIIKKGMRVAPDHVYFLPPNARVSLKSGAFELETRTGDGAFRPIDFFFHSLAAGQKNLAIGVVLSGMDADGSLGLKAIKAEAGIAIVQSPESARFPAMPRSSISADHVDMVLPPDQIARQLAELAKRCRAPEVYRLEEGRPAQEDDLYFGRILRQLKSVSGVDFRLYKPNTIRRRIARRILMHRMDTLAQYAAALQTDGKELRDLQEDILIGVTRFFRDPEVFETLKQDILPRMFEDRPHDRQLRIWVAGCSSGEEVYSIAMCLLEYFTGNVSEPSIQIFGTDASEQNIQRARQGLYAETVAGEIAAERLRRFFVKTEKGYQIVKRVRDLCIFARQNLCNDPPFSRLDLISCRNVLIYFGSHLQRQLVPTFHYALRPDGLLLLGASETIREFTDLFSLLDRKHKIYMKVGNAPPRSLLDAASSPFLADLVPELPNLQHGDVLSDVEIQRAADRLVLARYGPPGVVVDDRMEILQSRGHTGPFLELPPGAATLRLSRMLRESIASQVISAVKRAVEQNLPVQVDPLEVRDGEQTQQAILEVLPLHAGPSHSKCYLVLFVPRSANSISTTVAPVEVLPPETAEQHKDQIVAQLRNDLTSTRLYLQSLLEERDARNQDLISANEEIQSANEELQSTNEELETTKEELQSSNEELQTVNDELQNRNTVLTQTSNDLSNLLNSVNLPVLMLSNDLNIRHFTPQAQRLMNVRSTDIGRPFEDIRLNLNIDDLNPLFIEVLDTLGARELEVQDRDGRWYLLRIRPYRTTDNKIEGLVVVLVDIDQVRRSQQELRDARDFATSIIENITLPLVVVDSEFRIHSTNEAFCALASADRRLLEKRFLPDLAVTLWGMDQPLRSMLEGLRSDKAGRSFEFEYKADDTTKMYLVQGRPLQPDGKQFLLVTFEDLSAHREVERLLNAERERLAGEVESTTKELARSRQELRALNASLLTSQEEERSRVARELHDDIGQQLAAMSMAGDEILHDIEKDPGGARQELERILKGLGALAEDVRGLSHRLHPSMLEDLGLAAALRALTEEFGEREDMIATFYAQDVAQELPPEIATGLYRIAQEALRNVSKHAGKTHVKVQLQGDPGGLALQVMDSGKGFDMEQKPSGLGLISMRERAHLIGGTIQIQSAVREGTKVSVYVPLSSAS